MNQEIQNFVNGEITENIKTLANEFFINVSKEVKDEFIGKIIKDFNKVSKGSMREYFVASLMDNGPAIVKYITLQNEYIMYRIKKERERSWNYIIDKDEAEKYNFVNENDYKKGGKYDGKRMPKQTDEQSREWAEKASAKITVYLWESEMDLAFAKLIQ
jgi:hypothetical protein